MRDLLPPEVPKWVTELLQRPQSEWTLTDWRSLAIEYNRQWLSTLDALGNASAERDEARLSASASNDMLATVMLLTLLSKRKRQRGRPRKNDDARLLNVFDNWKAAFAAEFPNKRPTDRAVLTWYLEKECEATGRRTSRAHSLEVQKKLKAFVNRISDARNPRYRES